ncbi:hypothetical protein AMJ86_00715 [bacterium SM23_57]|nr:MAG: hypothetical protein AMJ86_00715 [bacterium SM23_57]
MELNFAFNHDPQKKYESTIHEADLLKTNARKQLRRHSAFKKYLEKIMPSDLIEIMEFQIGTYWEDYMEDYIRFLGNCKNDEQNTIKAVAFAHELVDNSGEKWELEKFFDEYTGEFSYELTRKIKWVYYVLILKNVSNVDGCVVKKKRRMRIIYETDCKDIK